MLTKIGMGVGIWLFAIGLVLYFNYCCHINDQYFEVEDKEE